MTQTSQSTMTDAALAAEQGDGDAVAAQIERPTLDYQPEQQPERLPVPHADVTRESCRARTPCASAECQIRCFLLALGVLCAMFLIASVVGTWLASNLLAHR